MLQQVSLHLRTLLFRGLAGDDDVGRDFTAETNISLASPAEISDSPSSEVTILLSLYLYQVTPNGHLRNEPLIPSAAGEQRYPPLSLDLSYLLTPLSTSPADNLVILGRAMQILEANTTIRAAFLDSDLRLRDPGLRVLMNPCSLEELTRIWNAFNQPYRLSLCYQVQPVSIDSARQPDEGPPVTESLIDVLQVGGRP